jgi:BirA family transcriptional regulator, biotin operon repressor / biotin---[acetyl-CoA-carboxylase] ligase
MVKNRMQEPLRMQCFGAKVLHFESIGSTNTFAKTLKEPEAPHGTVIIAEEQSDGHGRLGRQWQSASGENLLFTILLRPSVPAERLVLLPLAAAVGIAEGIEQCTGVPLETKWPNDLLYGRKKICGILIEGSIEAGGAAAIALGAGINVNQSFFPSDIEATAGSLVQITGHQWPKQELLNAVLACLEERYNELCSSFAPAILTAWKKRTTMLGKQITVIEQQNTFAATAVDLDPQGALIVRRTDGSLSTVYAGDVSIRNPE